MRVITQTLYGDSGDGAARRSVLVNGLSALQPNLVALQEAIVSAEYDQVTDLLGPDFYVAHQTERGANGSGSSVAGPRPVGDVHEVDLHVTPRTSDFACGALVAEIRAPDPVGPLLCVHHLPSWQLAFERERELQAVATARVVEDIGCRRKRPPPSR